MTHDSPPERVRRFDERLAAVFTKHAPAIRADVDRLVDLLESIVARVVTDHELDEARRTSHRLTGSLGLLGLADAADLFARVQTRLHRLPSTIDRHLVEEVRSIRPLLARSRPTSSSGVGPDCEG